MKKYLLTSFCIFITFSVLAQKEMGRDYKLDQRIKALNKARFSSMIIPAGEIHEITIPVTGNGNITAVSVRPSGISGCANCNVTGIFKYPPPGNSTIPTQGETNPKSQDRKLKPYPDNEIFFLDAQGKKYPTSINADGRFFCKITWWYLSVRHWFNNYCFRNNH